MSKRKLITKEEIFIKARMISEGVYIKSPVEDFPHGVRAAPMKNGEIDLTCRLFLMRFSDGCKN